MTIIKFERSGGVLGQNIDLDLDLNTLPATESRRLMDLVQQCDFFNLPQDLVAKTTPDEFHYVITVNAGKTRHVVRTSDTGAPESLRLLLGELSSLAMVR